MGTDFPCAYSVSRIWILDGIENKNDVYNAEDCLIKFCKSLLEHTMKTINFEKKEMIPLTKTEHK